MELSQKQATNLEKSQTVNKLSSHGGYRNQRNWNATAGTKKDGGRVTDKEAAWPSGEAAWPSGQRVGLAIQRSRVRVPLWPLAGFVLGRPEFEFSATLVNSQLVASCPLEF